MGYFSSVIKESRLSLTGCSAQSVQNHQTVDGPLARHGLENSSDISSPVTTVNKPLESVNSEVDRVTNLQQVSRDPIAVAGHVTNNPAPDLPSTIKNKPNFATEDKVSDDLQAPLHLSEPVQQGHAKKEGLTSADKSTSIRKSINESLHTALDTEGNKTVAKEINLSDVKSIVSGNSSHKTVSNNKLAAPRIVETESSILKDRIPNDAQTKQQDKVNIESEAVNTVLEQVPQDSLEIVKQTYDLHAEQSASVKIAANVNAIIRQAAIASNNNENAKQAAPAQVRIGQVNIVVESLEKPVVKTQSIAPSSDLASRLFLKGL